jgi:hypothetical protein
MEITLELLNELRLEVGTGRQTHDMHFRSKIHALKYHDASVVVKGPVPMNQIVRVVRAKKVLKSVWRTKARTQITKQIHRSDLILYLNDGLHPVPWSFFQSLQQVTGMHCFETVDKCRGQGHWYWLTND